MTGVLTAVEAFVSVPCAMLWALMYSKTEGVTKLWDLICLLEVLPL